MGGAHANVANGLGRERGGKAQRLFSVLLVKQAVEHTRNKGIASANGIRRGNLRRCGVPGTLSVNPQDPFGTR